MATIDKKCNEIIMSIITNKILYELYRQRFSTALFIEEFKARRNGKKNYSEYNVVEETFKNQYMMQIFVYYGIYRIFPRLKQLFL